MTRIGNVDHVLMLLQQQLQKLQSTGPGARTARVGRTVTTRKETALHRLAAISDTGDLGEQDLERALIRALLVDELGAGIADDHRFDRIAGEVWRLIADDPVTRNLLREAVGELAPSERGKTSTT